MSKGWNYGQRPDSQYYRFGKAAVLAGIRQASNLAMHRFVSSSSTASTQGEAESVMKNIVSNTEYGEGRRAPAFITRLHAAKYLQCDALMKELFFPILNMNRNFGFCSVSGIGRVTAESVGTGAAETGGANNPLKPQYPAAFAKANGCYRGFAMFTIRSDKMSRTDGFKLNSIPIAVGNSRSTGSSDVTYSPYRRFCNGPNFKVNQAGLQPFMGVDDMQTFQWAGPDQDETNFNQTKASISEVGNLLDLETAAIQSVNFQHAIGSSTSSEGTTATHAREDTQVGVNWDGTGNPKVGEYYYPNLRNTTVRIADGVLEMDVTNGKNSSVVLELVIHSQSKQEKAFTPQAFFDQVFQSVEYQQQQLRVDGPGNPAAGGMTPRVSAPGGWQAFYDPEYPFLSMKSAHSKKANQMYREVHRSIHVLSPGQSKTLKVFLGSHYYGLGNKTESPDGTGSNRMRPDWTAFPAGNLLVSLGHTGVSQLTMPSLSNTDEFTNLPDTYNATSGLHTVIGSGFWIGKQKAPSEIVVSGTYKEKFYPAYVISNERNNYDDYPMIPPTVYNSTYGSILLPAGQIVQDTVGVVQADKKAIPAKISTPFKEEL